MNYAEYDYEVLLSGGESRKPDNVVHKENGYITCLFRGVNDEKDVWEQYPPGRVRRIRKQRVKDDE